MSAEAELLIFCKNDAGKRVYYAGFNGQRGLAVVGAKADAVRFPPPPRGHRTAAIGGARCARLEASARRAGRRRGA